MRRLTLALLLLALVLAGLLALRAWPRPPQYGTSLDPGRTIPDLQFTADTGEPLRPFGDSEQLRLVFFGYTRCATCAATLNLLARTRQALPADQQRRLLILVPTLDPTYDTPARLQLFLSRFGPGLTGLSGTPEQTVTLLHAFLMPSGLSPAQLLAHSAGVMVLDRGGHFVRLYDAGDVAQGLLGADLPRLLRAYWTTSGGRFTHDLTRVYGS